MSLSTERVREVSQIPKGWRQNGRLDGKVILAVRNARQGDRCEHCGGSLWVTEDARTLECLNCGRWVWTSVDARDVVEQRLVQYRMRGQ